MFGRDFSWKNVVFEKASFTLYFGFPVLAKPLQVLSIFSLSFVTLLSESNSDILNTILKNACLKCLFEIYFTDINSIQKIPLSVCVLQLTQAPTGAGINKLTTSNTSMLPWRQHSA